MGEFFYIHCAMHARNCFDYESKGASILTIYCALCKMQRAKIIKNEVFAKLSSNPRPKGLTVSPTLKNVE